MANYEKQGKQEAAYPIPISLFPVPHCPVTVLQRYRDGVCSLLFPLFFIICHPYIPLHLVFYTCFTYFWLYCSYNHWGQAPRKSSGRYRFKKRAIDSTRSCCARAGKVGVVHDRKWRHSLLCHADDTYFHWRREMQE